MEMALEAEQAIFENAGQAVHVAFLVMAQEAMQDAPLRMALIRIMESVKLDNGNQRNWLDQLRGTASGAVNFSGLSGGEVRAQCAMITQAVKTNLPIFERWVIEAKFGQVEYEDVSVVGSVDATVLLERATKSATKLQRQLAQERSVLAGAASGPKAAYESLRASVAALAARLVRADQEVEVARVAFDRLSASCLMDNGPACNRPKPGAHGDSAAPLAGMERRFAFSRERIAAIMGLSEYFAPQFPRIKPLAIDLMLGRIYATHKKIEISSRDLADQFGGNHTKYLRASWKIKNQLRVIEENAIARLEPLFLEHGVIADFK